VSDGTGPAPGVAATLFSTLLQGAPPSELIAATNDVVRDVFMRHGAAAFASNRETAIVHETGHTIVAKHEGLKVRSVKVFRQGTQWSGRCMHGGGAWTTGPDSSIDDDLLHARVIIAGLAGEAITGQDRPGSSLDELALSQVIGCNVAVKLDGHSRSDEDYVAFAKALWHERVWSMACRILYANREPFMQIVQALHERGSLHGAGLAKVLAQVRRIEQ
jgi:hypothetical protein